MVKKILVIDTQQYPSDILIDNAHRNYNIFETGTDVDWSAGKPEYITQTGEYLKTNVDEYVAVDLIRKFGTIIIEPTPADATVVLTSSGYTQEGNQIKGNIGSVVTYTVSKADYKTISSSVTVTLARETIPVTLSTSATISLDIQNQDSTLKIYRNNILVENISNVYGEYSFTYTINDMINIEVEKTGYETYTNEFLLTEDKSFDISLTILLIDIIFNVTPNNLITIYVNGSPIIGEMIGGVFTYIYRNVPYGTTFTYKVEKVGYITQEEDYTVNTVTSPTTLNIQLLRKSFTIVLNVIDSDSQPFLCDISIWKNQQLIASGTDISTLSANAQYGDNISYTLSHTGYISISDNFVIEENKTITQQFSTTLPLLTLSMVSPTSAFFKIVNNTTSTVLYESDDTDPSTKLEEWSNYVNVNDKIYYKVWNTGYVIQETTETITNSITRNISLVELKTLTVTATPVDATIVLTSTGYTQVDNTIAVPQGFNVNYSIIKEGYVPIIGVKQVTTTETINFTLTQAYNIDEIVFESSTPGNYTLNLRVDGTYEVILVGGGSGALIANPFYSETLMASGASGGLSTITGTFSGGNHTLIIGTGGASCGENWVNPAYAGGTTYFDSYVANGGSAPYRYSAGPQQISNGVGGTGLTTNGINGYYVPQPYAAYGESVYNGYGKGGDCLNPPGDPIYPQNGGSGYIKVTYKGL